MELAAEPHALGASSGRRKALREDPCGSELRSRAARSQPGFTAGESVRVWTWQPGPSCPCPKIEHRAPELGQPLKQSKRSAGAQSWEEPGSWTPPAAHLLLHLLPALGSGEALHGPGVMCKLPSIAGSITEHAAGCGAEHLQRVFWFLRQT